ncbi:MAG: Asp-tRNA(Asn)/Glu-tRNA(Gln) amidotransferase subunit GatB [Patescibacteria group bacterium]|jgi:aspartyl-tRNA(Asn)/glutamyl-tRNA(Gln) amidotransferase subunit B
MNYTPVIGLEIHVQLKTKSKMFCGCDNDAEHKAPNTAICPVCTGQPGSLPVPNEQAVRWGILAGRALGCGVRSHSKFDRKHYFYPDLPKGYQISQFDEPIGIGGEVAIPGTDRTVLLDHIHLEEDAAKLSHRESDNASLVDFNRAGTPLIEIVTQPTIQSPEDAKLFLQELRLMMRYLDVSDADMEKGHLRCDANISMRPEGERDLYPKTEVKNLNSFRAVERALQYEIKRQKQLWLAGKPPMVQNTRRWNEARQETVVMREKETLADYRYFPDPDIPRLHHPEEMVQEIEAMMPEMPAKRRMRYTEQYGFPEKDMEELVERKPLGDYFEQVISEMRSWFESEFQSQEKEEAQWEKDGRKLSALVANWLINKFVKQLDDHGKTLKDARVTPENFAELMKLIWQNKVNSKAAQVILEELIATRKNPTEIMEHRGLVQMDDAGELDAVVDEVIAANEKVAAEIRAGNTKAAEALLGQVMAKTKGRANPQAAREMILKKLGG